MKRIIACIVIVFPFFSWCQYPATSIKIQGSIVSEIIITLDSLLTRRPAMLRNFPIVNKKGEVEYELKKRQACLCFNYLMV